MSEIDEISVKMSLTTEDFAKKVDDAITDALARAEDFEDRVRGLADSLRSLSEGAEVVFQETRGEETFEEIAERLIETGEVANKTVEQLVGEAEAVEAILTEVSQAYVENVRIMVEAAGGVLPEGATESLEAFARIEALAGKESDELAKSLSEMSAQIAKTSAVAKPAILEFERVKQRLAELGAVVPIRKMEQFRATLLEEAIAANEAGESAEMVARRVRSMGDAFIEANDGISEGAGFLNDFKQSLGGMLSKLAPAAIAIGLIVKGIAAVNRIVQESIQITLQYSESQRLLAIAVLEHQRAVDEQSPTVQEANVFANQLADTYGRTRLEMMELTRQSLFLTKDLKLSKDETEGLAESAVIMSEAFGTDAQSALRNFTNFLNTGYTQGLQGLGFSLDQNSLRLEALKRGYIELGQEMSEQIQRMVGLELITERANEVQDDVIAGQDELQQQLEETNAALEAQKLELGEALTPTWLELQVVGLKALTGIVDGLEGVGLAVLTTIASLSGLGKVITQLFSGQNLGEVFREEQARSLTEMLAIGDEEVDPGFGALQGGLLDMDEKLDLIAGSADEAKDALAGFSDEVITASDKALPLFDKEAQKFEAGIIRIDQRLDQTLLNIERQFESRRLNLQINLAKNLASIDRQANERRIKSTMDFQVREEREKQDHLLRMSRLEEDFLFDLDDAVRERDALAVLQLQRRHNLEKKRAEEDFKNKKTRRGEDFELELKEIERQRVIRRQLAIDEFNQRMEMLAEEERLRAERAREDAERQKQLLEDQMEQRLRLVVKALGEELNLNAEELQQLFQLMEQYYGANGWFVQLVDGYYTWLAGQGSIGTPDIPGTTSGSGADIPVGGGPQQFQRGADFIATSPQLISIAEGSPERIQITPLTGATMAPRGDAGMGGASGRVGIDLDIALEDGLMAEVADQVMSEVADVITNIRRGGRR